MDMDLISLVVVLIIVGMLLWMVTTYSNGIQG